MSSGWRHWSLLLLLGVQAAWATIMDVQYSAPAQPQTQPPPPAQATPLACETSGICSLGRVKPFMGDIVPPAAMRACLESRSFKQELILLTENRLNPAYQTFRSLLALGYEHVVLLSSPERCARSNATWPRLGCAWSSQRLLNSNKLLMDRVAFMARAGRLGYNVLMLDSDVIPFRDLYSLLWAPPLGQASLLAMRDGNGWLNCGVVYIRKARPDGPAVYILAEVLDRLERWADAPHFFAARGLNSFCWDQQMYSDTLLSAVAGRPVSYGCWLRFEPSLHREWDEAHVELLTGTRRAPLEHTDYLKHQALQWPQELLSGGVLHPNTGAAETWMTTIRVPNSQGVWPADLGGELYPPTRGETSQEWIDILTADGPPLWPDPEDPTKAAAAAALTETFAYLPMYLAETWSLGGAFGHWNPALLRPTGQPPVALAHFVHVPGGATNKLTVKMASNNWDWDVAHAAHPNRGVFFASSRAAPVPDVLAYSTELVAAQWPNEEVFGAAALALLRLAMEMGRAAAFPAPRCNLSWLGGVANNRLPLAVHHGFHIPYAPAARGFDDLRCLWGGYLPHGCQAVRPYFSGGLLAPEYDHLLDLLHQDGGGAANGAAAGADGGSAAARRSATHLASLGFTVGPDHMAAAPEGGGTGSGGGSGEVVTVLSELLRPPAAGGWDVTALAAALMDKYGGPGSGLLCANATVGHADAAAAAEGGGGEAAAAATACGGGGAGGASRPRVLVLSEVPRLTERLGPRHELFRQELESGPDRAFMSCDWIRTGRPYRRLARLARSSNRRRRLAAAAAAALAAPEAQQRRRQQQLQLVTDSDDLIVEGNI